MLIPCYNEEGTIGKVIEDFKRIAPAADIYVFDNNSFDLSATVAKKAGAKVIRVPKQGKGHVLRAMLSKIDSDIYVIVDGDDTYPAEELPKLITPILDGRADMVVGSRLNTSNQDAFPSLHHFGNRLFRTLVDSIFGANLQDILSGYRVFTRSVAKGLPLVAGGFETEAEMTIQCLYYDFMIQEVDVCYRARPTGSESKLHTFSDGLRILLEVFHLLRAYKPLTVFGGIGLVAAAAALVLTITSASSGLGSQANSLGLVRDSCWFAAVVLVSTGIMLHSLNYRVKEIHSVLVKEGRSAGGEREAGRLHAD